MAELGLTGFSEVVLLGSGGLGDVYRARRDSTSAPVAIKVLRDWSDHDVAWKRAERELRALVDLRGHSHVVNVEEVIEANNGRAIVMEYAPGGSVGELATERGGTLTFPEALMVATHTTAALAAAHERGIIHRDIKPHNLLIDAFGQVKVCDFGIAALTHSDDVSNRTSSLSLRYASPEELRGDDGVGPAADIYSLAATIHQLLTGQYLPAPDGTAGSLPLRSWTSPDDLPADIDVEFRGLSLQSADRNPANRPTASDLHDRLDAIANRLGPARCRALPFVTHDLDDATRVRSLPVAGTGATSSPVTPPPVIPTAAASATMARTTVDGPGGSNDTVARTTAIVAEEAPPESAPRRWPIILATTAVALLAVGGAGFALGWFDRDDDQANASVTSSSIDDGGTIAATPTDATVVATASTATTATTAAPTTAAPTTAAPTTAAPTAPPTTLPPRYAAPTCPGPGECITMRSIELDGGEYRIVWEANFPLAVAADHAHFFWDVYDASQVGSSSADQAPWELTDAQPFIPTGEMSVANRPSDADGICVTPANSSHEVIDPSYFHCALVAPGEDWTLP